MKRIMIGTGLFLVGLLVGAGAAGAVVQKIYQDHMAEMYSFGVGGQVLIAEQLRAGESASLLEQTDGRIVRWLLELHQNESLKNLTGTQVSTTAVKKYYTCSKTPISTDIAPILSAQPEPKCD